MKKRRKEKAIKIIGISSFVILVSLILFIIMLFLISHSKSGVNEDDYYFMEIAYEEAELAAESGNVPVGAVLVINETIVSRAHNKPGTNQSYGSHAEILAIKKPLEN